MTSDMNSTSSGARRNLKRDTIISIRTSESAAKMLDKIVQYHSDLLGTRLTRGQVVELLFAKELSQFEKSSDVRGDDS